MANIGRYECEIFIFSKKSPIFTYAQEKLESSADYRNVDDCDEDSFEKQAPIFQHWILVSKFRGLTLWMDATEKKGLLHPEILDSEPEDIEKETRIGIVKISIPEMMKLFYNNKLNGKEYSLCDANCQKLIKTILRKLKLGRKLKIINNIADENVLEKLETERKTFFQNKSNTTNNKRRIRPEIWIYTTTVEASLSGNMNDKVKSLIKNALVPVLKHWILVIKFRSVTFWIDANKHRGMLCSRFLEKEPYSYEDRIPIGSVNLTIKGMINLYDKVREQFRGEKYSLSENNCQSWILSFLKELKMGEGLTIINDVMIAAGAAALAGLALCSLASLSSRDS